MNLAYQLDPNMEFAQLKRGYPALEHLFYIPREPQSQNPNGQSHVQESGIMYPTVNGFDVINPSNSREITSEFVMLGNSNVPYSSNTSFSNPQLMQINSQPPKPKINFSNSAYAQLQYCDFNFVRGPTVQQSQDVDFVSEQKKIKSKSTKNLKLHNMHFS
jgi:hypothetical protein